MKDPMSKKKMIVDTLLMKMEMEKIQQRYKLVIQEDTIMKELNIELI